MVGDLPSVILESGIGKSTSGLLEESSPTQ